MRLSVPNSTDIGLGFRSPIGFTFSVHCPDYPSEQMWGVRADRGPVGDALLDIASL